MPVAERRAGARAGALRLHRLVESAALDLQPSGRGQILDEVERDAVRVVQPERGVAGDEARARLRRGERRFQARQAVDQYLVELFLLAPHRRGDRLAVRLEFRIGMAHLGDDDGGEFVQERLVDPQLLSMTHRTPHDLSQHVPAPFVGGDDAVRNEKRHRAEMIRDDAERDIRRVVRRAPRERAIRRAGPFADRGEQRREEIGVVVRQGLLQYGNDPLESHPGVDRRRRQRHERPVVMPLKLHEDVVPDLDVAVARTIDAETGRRWAGQVVAPVVVHLRATAARPGVAHRPEVLGHAQLRNPIGRHERAPDVVRLVVARDAVLPREDGHVQPVGRQCPDVRQQLPGERDRVRLEVVAE